MSTRLEFFKAEMAHDVDLILCHGTERVSRVIAAAVRLGTVAVAAQIGKNDRKFLRQPRRHLVPANARKGIAVHQQQRWSFSPVADHDIRAISLDAGLTEAF